MSASAAASAFGWGVGSSAVNSAFDVTGNLLSAGTQYHYNKKLMDRQNAYNVENATTAYNRSLDYMQTEFDYGRQFYQDYETAAAQRQQLVAAGYNPNALVSDGYTAATSTEMPAGAGVPQASVSGQSAGLPSTGSSNVAGSAAAVASAGLAPAQLDLLRAQEGLDRANITKTEIENLLNQVTAAGKELDNSIKQIELQYKSQEIQQQLDIAKQNWQKLVNDNTYFEHFGIVGGAVDLQNRMFQNTHLENDIKKQVLEIEWLPKQYALQAALWASETTLNTATANLQNVNAAGTQYTLGKQKYFDKIMVGPAGISVIQRQFNCSEFTARIIAQQIISGNFTYDFAKGALGDRDLSKYGAKWFTTLSQIIKNLSPLSGLINF